MNPLADESAERAWAIARFREYLLGRLNADDNERLTMDVAVYSGLVDDLEDTESDLIDQYLDSRLSSDEQGQFERQYVHTNDLDNQDKLQLQRALRSKEVERLVEASRPSPIPRPRLAAWSLVAASAALIAVGVFAGIYYFKSRELAAALAELRVKQAPPPIGQQNPQEQQAGSSSPEGLVLSARISGTGTVYVAAPPERLIWTPVLDYRASYRFRIYSSDGSEITSPPVTPRNNAIDYPVENSSSLPLPWDIFVLSGDTASERVLAHYVIRKP
jgi:hypothetical protein